MYGIDRLGIGVLFHHPTDSAKHPVHGLAQILSPMGGHQNETTAISPSKIRVTVVLFDSRAQRIDARVSCHVNLLWFFFLSEKISRGPVPWVQNSIARLCRRPGG